jgi:hypothetical protein
VTACGSVSSDTAAGIFRDATAASSSADDDRPGSALLRMVTAGSSARCSDAVGCMLSGGDAGAAICVSLSPSVVSDADTGGYGCNRYDPDQEIHGEFQRGEYPCHSLVPRDAMS